MNRSGIMVVLLLVACVILFPYTWGGLVWDDHILLTEGLWKEGSVSSIWMQSVQGGEIASQYYRPIPMTIFALVQSITMLHTIALLLHLGSTWLMSEWLHSRFEQTGIVYLGALLFALHPIQTEVLGWASCLPDILAVHFGLWSVMFAVKERSAWWTAGALLCGLLSKEIALLPLLAFGVDGFISDRLKNQRWRIPSWGVPVGLVLLLVATLRMVFQVETVLPTAFDSVPRTTLVTIGMGWFSWLVPFPHSPVRDVWVLPMWSVYVGWAWSLVCLLTIRNRMAWLIVMGGLIVSLPPVWVGYFAAERYLYVASIGFVWLTCTVIFSSRSSPQLIKALAIVWILSTGVIHWNRSAIWSSDERLFAAAVEVLPTSGYAWHLQGLSQIQRGDFVAGFQSFQMASSQEHIHHQSGEFAIRSALEAGLKTEAFQFAESGPKVGLSRGYLEAWLQAAQAVENAERTSELRRTLGL